MSERRLIIFDCDGTLVDSQHMIVTAMNQAFDTVGVQRPPREATLGIVGLSLHEAIWRLTDGADHEIINAIREQYRDAWGTLVQDPDHNEPMYDGAREAVLDLAAQPDVVLAIATGKSRRGVDRVLEKFGLTDCFKAIQTADDAPSKPHPGMIENALMETGTAASGAVMIGDTSFDMEMARNAGVAALGVAWGYHPVERLHAGGAQAVADDYAHLMQLLGTLTANEVAAE